MKNIGIELKWAIYFVAMTLAWMLMEKMTGLHSTYIEKHPIYTNFIAIPAIAIYVFALLEKREKFYSGKMTYGQGFISGLIITAIVTILSPVTQYVTSTFITPEFFPNAIDASVRLKMMTQADAEKYFSLGNYIKQGLIGAPIMGIITSALVALFTKKK